jgi:hypothetical protein
MPPYRTSAGLAALALTAILGLLPAPAQAQPQTATTATMEVAAFLRTLDDLEAGVRAAPDAGLAEAGASWPKGWKVRVADEVVDVSSAPLTTVSETGPARRAALLARVAAMRDEASRLTTGGPAPPPHVRAALADVLAAPEFRGRDRYTGLLALVDRLRTWVRSWWPSLPKAEHTVVPIVRVISWVVAGAAFVILAFLVFRLLRGSTREASARFRDTGSLDPADARTWARRAREAAAAGDAREAVRCAYHAVLHRLDEQGAWTIEEARTPREYVRLLASADGRRPAVSFVARLFEGTWYGGQQPGIADAQAALVRLGELGCDAHADPAT